MVQINISLKRDIEITWGDGSTSETNLIALQDGNNVEWWKSILQIQSKEDDFITINTNKIVVTIPKENINGIFCREVETVQQNQNEAA